MYLFEKKKAGALLEKKIRYNSQVTVLKGLPTPQLIKINQEIKYFKNLYITKTGLNNDGETKYQRETTY